MTTTSSDGSMEMLREMVATRAPIYRKRVSNKIERGQQNAFFCFYRYKDFAFSGPGVDFSNNYSLDPVSLFRTARTNYMTSRSMYVPGIRVECTWFGDPVSVSADEGTYSVEFVAFGDVANLNIETGSGPWFENRFGAGDRIDFDASTNTRYSETEISGAWLGALSQMYPYYVLRDLLLEFVPPGEIPTAVIVPLPMPPPSSPTAEVPTVIPVDNGAMLALLARQTDLVLALRRDVAELRSQVALRSDLAIVNSNIGSVNLSTVTAGRNAINIADTTLFRIDEIGRRIPERFERVLENSTVNFLAAVLTK